MRALLMTDDDEAELLALAARVAALEQASDVETDAAKALNEKIDLLLAGQASAPANFHWPDLEPDDRQRKWEAFFAWVQNVLAARYPDAAEVLLPCWWQHTDALDAVTACWFTWLHAYKNGEALGTYAGNWHSTYLPGMIGQVTVALASCGEAQHEPNQPPMLATKTLPVEYPA